MNMWKSKLRIPKFLEVCQIIDPRSVNQGWLNQNKYSCGCIVLELVRAKE